MKLLPHEVSYLTTVSQFESNDRQKIMDRVKYNVRNPHDFKPYDKSIDKRKYYHVKNWIKKRLKEVDVDEQLQWLLKMEKKVTTDSINPKEEKKLLKAFRNYKHATYNFKKLYEVGLLYRHFLLIRMRYQDYKILHEFLEKYRKYYHQSLDAYEKLHEVSSDIVNDYARKDSGKTDWKEWLTDVFFDKNLDGQLRYQAFVRLTFLCYNSKDYSAFEKKLTYLDDRLSKGKYYSRRLLLNYYNNKLMYHAHFKEYDKAIEFGNLAVRYINRDSILYVNNLCAVLLRTGQNERALKLMEKAFPYAKELNNFHNRIGFVAFYIKTLTKNNQYTKACRYGRIFLQGYHKEILKYRWFLFFSFYLEAMLRAEEYAEIISIVSKNKLLKRIEPYKTKSNYIPIIPVIYYVAQFRIEKINNDQLLIKLNNHLDSDYGEKENISKFQDIIEDLNSWLPELTNNFKQKEG